MIIRLPVKGRLFIYLVHFWLRPLSWMGAFSYLQTSDTRILGMEHR